MIIEAFLICALSLPLESAWHPPLTNADHSFFRMLDEISGGYITLLPRPYNLEALQEMVFHAHPGSILLVENNFGMVHKFFKGRNWERLPMSWRGYYIYRKRGSA